MTEHPDLAATERAMREHVGSLGLDYEAALAVSSVYRAANAVRAYAGHDLLRSYDLTWTGFVVMWVVWIFDGMETRHAAEAAAISKGTLTGVVKTLEGRGWMRRVGRDDDRRLVEVHLTDEGKQVMRDLYPQFNAIESKVVARVPAEELAAMTSGLREIVLTIEETQQH
ncbi:MarR family winged helix-turn-helix transcriptional regulator [Paractinoplanes maris]|uniref:MarR family winged helix-turn-helix transcriptional regulator n=1 Tax=Paractinoplanes maris TaxID=1734446 RepID=UPI0020205471|nr:MarR family transcriptional regulator [Actinoplanes maris]